MKYGPRKPSLTKSISARTKGAATRAAKKMLIPGYGQKGRGWLTECAAQAPGFIHGV